MDGICTLANDKVYDQLFALLNSIEANLGSEMPVCVYPYDDDTEQIAAEIARRPNVQLYQDRESIDRWDRFVRNVWDTHPTARQRWSQTPPSPPLVKGSSTSDSHDPRTPPSPPLVKRGQGGSKNKVGEEVEKGGSKSDRYYRVGTHRRYCAFDGPFDRFIYMDADTLLMGPLEPVFTQLNESDWVVYDFQYKEPNHVYDLSSRKLAELFPPHRIQSEIFCSGFYASKKGIFEQERRDSLLGKLVKGEAEVLYPMAPDQAVLNYMVMRSGLRVYNFALQLPKDEITGCCVTSTHFEERDHILYDRGNPLTYLHYIGIKYPVFARLCSGENIDFPYRELFLHYRYLHEPEKRPEFKTKPIPYKQPPPSLAQRVLRKFGLTR